MALKRLLMLGLVIFGVIVVVAAGVPQTWTNLIMQLRARFEFQAQVNRCGLYIALKNHVAIGYVGR